MSANNFNNREEYKHSPRTSFAGERSNSSLSSGHITQNVIKKGSQLLYPTNNNNFVIINAYRSETDDEEVNMEAIEDEVAQTVNRIIYHVSITTAINENKSLLHELEVIQFYEYLIIERNSKKNVGRVK